MNLGTFRNMNDAWTKASLNVLEHGNSTGNTLEASNIQFAIRDINDNILTVRHNFALHYYLGEMIWYAAGKNDVNFISKFGKIWEILSDDGVTNNSAYGYILMKKHGFNQIDKMIELLEKDPNSRRAVMNINIPNEKVIDTKDEMCSIALQVLLRDNKLHMTGIMRSNDLWTGTPYDIYYFTEIQKYIANKLNVDYGTYTHFVTSMHIYDRDVDKIEKSVNKYIENLFNDNDKIKINGQKILSMGEQLYEELKDVPRKNIKKELSNLIKKYDIVEYK